MANGHIRTKNFRWPEPSSVAMERLRSELAARSEAEFDAAVRKVVRDRDELLAALEAIMGAVEVQAGPTWERAEALLARIKSS